MLISYLLGHMRAHLETIALEKDLDPLNPESWYSLSRTDMLVEHKVSSFIISSYSALSNLVLFLYH